MRNPSRSLACIVAALAFVNTVASAQSTPGQDQTAKPSVTKENDVLQSPTGIKILSDTQGVDFSPYLREWYRITRSTWNKLIPNEVNSPTSKQGQDLIRFKLLPSGKLMAHSMVLEGRLGDEALDRAAWGALIQSKYPPLPKEFHGPFLELRALFLYNIKSSNVDPLGAIGQAPIKQAATP